MQFQIWAAPPCAHLLRMHIYMMNTYTRTYLVYVSYVRTRAYPGHILSQKRHSPHFLRTISNVHWDLYVEGLMFCNLFCVPPFSSHIVSNLSLTRHDPVSSVRILSPPMIPSYILTPVVWWLTSNNTTT